MMSVRTRLAIAWAAGVFTLSAPALAEEITTVNGLPCGAFCRAWMGVEHPSLARENATAQADEQTEAPASADAPSDGDAPAPPKPQKPHHRSASQDGAQKSHHRVSSQDDDDPEAPVAGGKGWRSGHKNAKTHHRVTARDEDPNAPLAAGEDGSEALPAHAASARKPSHAPAARDDAKAAPDAGARKGRLADDKVAPSRSKDRRELAKGAAPETASPPDTSGDARAAPRKQSPAATAAARDAVPAPQPSLVAEPSPPVPKFSTPPLKKNLVADKPVAFPTFAPAPIAKESAEPPAAARSVAALPSPAATSAAVPAANLAAPAETTIDGAVKPNADVAVSPSIPETRASAETPPVAPVPSETTEAVAAPAPAPAPTTLGALDGDASAGQATRQQVMIVLAQPEVKSPADLRDKAVIIAGVDLISDQQMKASFAAAGASGLAFKQGSSGDVAQLWSGKVAAAVVAVAEPEAASAFHAIPGYKLLLVHVEQLP